MNLAELISAYGGDDVQFQALDVCADAMNMAKGHTRITFGTAEPLGPNGTINMGIVVWMDRDRVAKILAAEEAGSGTLDQQSSTHSALTQRVETLESALRFYANEEHWSEYSDDTQAAMIDRNIGSEFSNDLGAKARAALAAKDSDHG